MSRFIFIAIATVIMGPAPEALAQETAYVQIEAQPNLATAQDRLRDYASALPDVNGFELGRGWYGIALGPYQREEAARVLRKLRAERLVPRDSYIKGADRYGRRISITGQDANTTMPITEAEASDSSTIPRVTQNTDLETPYPESVATTDDLQAQQNDMSAVMQAGFYVQIEAQPNLATAQDRLRDYASALPDVNGFELGRGWYGIALGPYQREEAARVLRKLRAERLVPRDSYIKGADRYGRRISITGQDAKTTLPVSETEDVARTEPDQRPARETRRQAQKSELQLVRQERMALQLALEWSGFYNAAIDGAFGPSTRYAMAAWQQSNGFEATGILTTAQRAELLSQYNAILDGMDIQTVRDTSAGISIDLPLGVVAFDRYESPLVHFKPTGTVEGARVLLVSQPGDSKRLAGLYEIMQTLDIVPLDGPRVRNSDSFTLTGQNGSIVSHTQAWLDDDIIKGFTLIWPVGDEERRIRILAAMQSSFAPIDGVLAPTALPEDTPNIDLVSGITLDKPKASASGFFVNSQGVVVTTQSVIADCDRITLNKDDEAEVVLSDPTLGVAVLRTSLTIDQTAVAHLNNGTPRLRSEVAVAGYSFGGILPSAAMTFGHIANLRGLNDEDTLFRLEIRTLQGDAGGPVMDESGAVIGMLVADATQERQLPDNVNFALNARTIQQVLSNLSMLPQLSDDDDRIHPEDLTRKATAMTVVVNCWE